MPSTRLAPVARRLRVNEALAESLLWEQLRDRRLGGWKWKRQVPRGRFVVDFHCADASLVVEVGGWVHREGGRAWSDHLRTEALEAMGLRVIRFQNNDVVDKRNAVQAAILGACDPSPNPLPARGERD
jgi:very-short-patch-repair endonuclease